MAFILSYMFKSSPRPRQAISVLIVGVCVLFWFSTALAGPDGAALYARHCSACHGENGNGGVGVPLALPAFQAGVSDRYLRATIAAGRPGRVMPAFPQLSGDEVNAIVAHLRSWWDGTPPEFAQTPVRGDVQRGGTLYAHKCAACHGEDARGAHGTGVTFSRPRDQELLAPALNNSGFLASASDQLIHRAIREGRAETPMPAAKDLGLGEQDINDLVAYIRAFQASASAIVELDSVAQEPAVLVYESAYGLAETIANVERAAIGKNFRLIRVQTLDDGLVEKEQERKQQSIVYFCNFQFLNDALAIDPRVGLFLPCRVTVVEYDGKVEVISINPKRLALLFNNDELNLACEEMHRIYEEILEEATL